MRCASDTFNHKSSIQKQRLEVRKEEIGKRKEDRGEDEGRK
jgi:hypothetical protein